MLTITVSGLALGADVAAADGAPAITVMHLLQEARVGTAEPTLAVAASALTADTMLPVASDPGLERRWYRILSDTLASVPEPQQRAVCSGWSERIAWLLDHADPGDRERLAAACLPDPAAVAIIARAAACCADRGQSERSLAMDLELELSGVASVGAWRRDRFLSGRWPDGAADASAWTFDLPRPGPAHLDQDPQPASAWRITATQVARVDPWGLLIWRRAFAAPMTALPCSSGVVVRDPTGIHLLRADGSLAAMVGRDDAPTIIPSDAGVVIGNRDVWQCRGWGDGRGQTLSLPAPSLITPVVQGPFSAWLTREDVLVYRGARPIARIRHEASVDGRWRLAWSTAGVALRAPDGGQLLFPLLPAAEALAQSGVPDAVARADPGAASRTLEWLLRTYQGDLSLHWWGAHPDQPLTPWQRQRLLATLLSDGIPEQLRASGQMLLSGADELQAPWWYTLLQTRPATATLARQARQSLLRLGASQDQGWFPADSAWYGEPAETWPHGFCGAVLRQRLARPVVAWPQTLNQRAPVRPGPAWADETADDSTAWRFAVVGSDTATDITCRGADSQVRWHHAWPAPFLHSAADRTHALHDGWLLITEGDARLCVVDALDGTRRATIADPDDDLDASLVLVRSEPQNGGAALAVLGPPGLCNQLTLIDASGRRCRVALAESARWQVRAPGGAVLVMGSSGQATLIDAAGHCVPCLVPPALATSAQASSSAQGIHAGMAWFLWNQGSP